MNELIKIIFSAEINGRQYSSVSCNGKSQICKNIDLIADENNRGRYTIEVSKKAHYLMRSEVKTLILEAEREVDYFVNVLCYLGGSSPGLISCIGYKHNSKITTYEEIMETKHLGFRAILIGGWSIASVETTEIIISKLDGDYNYELIRRVNYVKSIKDPVTKYLSMYSLLLHKIGDNQKILDKKLLEMDETINETKSPIGDYYETVFTRLRNEIAHKRDGTNIIQTHREIMQQLDRFEELVFKIVFDKK